MNLFKDKAERTKDKEAKEKEREAKEREKEKVSCGFGELLTSVEGANR